MIYLGGIYGVSKPKLYMVSFFFSPTEHKKAYYKAFLQSFEIVTAKNAKEAKSIGLKKAKSDLGNGEFTRVRVNILKK
jgi:hypothetical protein